MRVLTNIRKVSIFCIDKNNELIFELREKSAEYVFFQFCSLIVILTCFCV
jgi:hypothetical protein